MKKHLLLLMVLAFALGCLPASADVTDGYYMIQNTKKQSLTNDQRFISVIGNSFSKTKVLTNLIGDNDCLDFQDCIKMTSPTCDTTVLGESAYHSEPGAVLMINTKTIKSLISSETGRTLSSQGTDTYDITGYFLTITDKGDSTFVPSISVGVTGYLQDINGFDVSSTDTYKNGVGADTYWIKKIDGSEEYFGATATNKIADYYYTTLRTAFNYTLSDGVKAYVVSDLNGTLTQIAQGGEIVNAGTKVILQCNGQTAKENMLYPTTESNSTATESMTNRLLSGSNYFHYAYNKVINHSDTIERQVNAGEAFSSSNANYRILGIQADGKMGFYQTYKDWAAAANSNISCIDGNQCYFDTESDLTIIGTPASITVSDGYPGTGDTATVTIERNAEMNASVGVIEYSLDGGATWIETTDGIVSVTSDTAGTVTVLARMNNGGVPSETVQATVQFWEVTDLCTIASSGVTDNCYKVTGSNLQCVYRFTAANGDRYLVVHDDAQAADNYVNVQADELAHVESYLTDAKGNAIDQKLFTQNNWALIKVYSDDDYAKVNVTIKSVTGQLTDNNNIIIDATDVEEGDEIVETAMNTYTPLSFWWPDHVNWNGHEYELHREYGTTKVHDYFFMPPKRNELAKIVWIVYADDGKFYVPQETYYNPYQMAGGVKPIWDYNQYGTPSISANQSYELTAIIKSTIVPYPGTSSVPRKVSTVTPFTAGYYTPYYEIYPLDVADENSIVTAVSDVRAERDVQSVRYYDLTGRTCAKPFEGVNVVVTTYTDGSHTTAKVLK